MRNGKRGRYTLEFKQESARLVESGQSQAAAARSLGVVEQTLGNWVREHRAGTLKGAGSKPQVYGSHPKAYVGGSSAANCRRSAQVGASEGYGQGGSGGGTRASGFRTSTGRRACGGLRA